MRQARRIGLWAGLLALGCGSASGGDLNQGSGGASGGSAGSPAGGAAGVPGGAGGSPPVDAGLVDARPAMDAGTPTFDAGMPPPPFECAGKAGPKGNRLFSVTTGGRLRLAQLRVPESYDPTKGAMLVLNYHGFTSDPLQQEILTGMTALAEERGFIVAYPRGTGLPLGWNAGDCCGPAWDPINPPDDVAFARTLIDSLSAEYCIDPRRIFATGMSNGGFMSHRLACEVSDKVAAIAPVAGVLGVDPAQCDPGRPVPVLQFHGTEDPLVPFGGGPPLSMVLPIPGIVFRSVDDTMAHWRGRNGCANPDVVFFQQGDVTCREWPACTNIAATSLCVIDAGGHTWPSGFPIGDIVFLLGKTSMSIDATRAMVSFFEAHPMP